MPTLDDLQRINSEVNQIPYDTLIAPGESPYLVKDTPDGGDWVCRDYAVRKSIELQQLGMTENDYSLVICWTELTGPITNSADPHSGRERHEVLAVDLDGQLLIMDSRYERVGVWNDAPWTAYLWEHQQIVGTTDFRDASTGLV
jgi:predicted transglutaminase-like cysteine proteinase